MVFMKRYFFVLKSTKLGHPKLFQKKKLEFTRVGATAKRFFNPREKQDYEAKRAEILATQYNRPPF